jgi:hypothetical protein
MGIMELFGLLFPLAVAFAAGFALRGYMDRRGHFVRLAAYLDRLRRRGEMD